MNQWAGKRATVMGLGRFGGGVGVASWLAQQGADVLVTDLLDAAAFTEPITELERTAPNGSIRYALGTHEPQHFVETDAVIVNPAVPRPWLNPHVRAAAAAGVRVTTEIELVVERLPNRSRVIGVTGSVGKSTTAAMIAHMLATTDAGCALAGNIGGTLLNQLDALPASRWVVLELSSAMLWWINRAHTLSSRPPSLWSPGLSVVTPFAPNHLDWHHDLAHYEDAKRSLLEAQHPGDHAVFAASAPDWPIAPGVRTQRAGELAERCTLAVPGAHNRDNAALALAAVLAAGAVSESRAVDSLRSFPGLPHRLQALGEFAAKHGTIRAFNDSKSTTPEATVRAVEAVAPLGPVRLIAGGYDKGVSLDAINSLPLAGLYAIGATASMLKGQPCGTLEVAVERAMNDAHEGDVILLSPGCASWDQFTNFTQRGECFIQSLQSHARQGNPI